MNRLLISGICSVCKRRRRVRRDGKVRWHVVNEWSDNNGGFCGGSNKPPLDYDKERNWFCNTECSGCADMIEYGV